MASTTTYDIQLRYLLDDRAVRGAVSLSRSLREAARSSSSLESGFRRVGAAVVGFFGAREAAHALIGFNAEMDQMKISMAAIMQLNLGGSFGEARAQAEGLVKEFQRFAVLTPVTTKDVTEFGTNISAAVFGAGGGMKEFVNIAEQGVIASKVFGAEAGYAAVELTELLQGVVNKRMRFAMQLLHAAHVTEEQFRAMTAAQRMQTLQRVLNSDAMRQASQAYSESFTGVTSTLVDNLQIALGRVGLPLFKAITKEVQEWNKWISENQATIESWAKRFGGALVEGFRAVRAAVGWIVQNSEILLGVAKAWLAVKAINFAGAVGGSVVNTFTLFQKGLAGSIAGLGALAAAAYVVAGVWENAKDLEHGAKGRVNPLRDYMARRDRGEISRAEYESMLYGRAKDEGYITGGNVDRLKLERDLITATNGVMGQNLANRLVPELQALASKRMLEAAEKMVAAANQNAALQSQLIANPAYQYLAAWARIAPTIVEAKVLPRPQVNVTIQRIEVHSDDPDRFIFALNERVAKVSRNPGRARETLKEF